jgi:Putative heme iron utilization protein
MTRERVLSAADVDRIVTHMNEDHADDLVRYAQVYADVSPVKAARMTGIDVEGLDLEVDTEGATAAVRIDFDTSLDSAAEARSALVDLALEARDEAER